MAAYQASADGNSFNFFCNPLHLFCHEGPVAKVTIANCYIYYLCPMKSAYIKYLRNLLIFSAVLGFTAMIIHFILPKTSLTPALPFLFAFFISTSLLSFYYLLQSTQKRFIKFINTYLLTILIKLFVYAGVMVSYAFMNRADAIAFMLGFFILYLCYTIFEAASIIKYTQPSTPGDKAS